MNGIILRYHEISLKGGNRGRFEHLLGQNAQKLVERLSGDPTPPRYRLESGRILLECKATPQVKTALNRLFGLANFSPVHRFPTQHETLEAIVHSQLAKYLETNLEPKTFRIQTRRIQKKGTLPSIQVNQEIGASILRAHPQWKVDLERPELTIGIEICIEESSIWFEKLPGIRGLPVGSTGHVLSLISGGIDSPVAALQALKRGTKSSFIHFYGIPFVGEETLTKVEELVRRVNHFQPFPQPLYIVPFGKIQEEIALQVNPGLRTLIYRRLMFRIATQLAEEIGALALVTGESLAQVASQTLFNMSALDKATPLPILRPLITFDKDEIIELAKKWETYQTSIQPGVDCCTLFADRHPNVKSTAKLLDKIESQLPVDEWIKKAMGSIEKRKPS